jgi:hypothetical protein
VEIIPIFCSHPVVLPIFFINFFVTATNAFYCCCIINCRNILFFIVKKAFSFSNLIFLWAKKHYLFFILLFFAVISHKQWDSGGILSNSLAIATDAAHLLADLAGFMISLLAIYIAGRRSTRR